MPTERHDANNVAQRNATSERNAGLSLIPLIHHGPDGYLTLHRIGPAGNWHDIGAIRIDRLKTQLPRIASALEADSFISINTMFGTKWEWEEYKGKWRKQRRTAYDLPIPHRRADAVRWLNAVFVDI